ncbi:MAG: hypothetical protein HUU15_07065 [Candidatus Brocadiae bacterium]|nr:hypothetical protein [Candidatus Brocadiia bacterium]
MSRLAVTAMLLASSLAWAGDRDKKEKPAAVPADSIRWASSWEEALAEAKERNVPIQVAFHKDH